MLSFCFLFIILDGCQVCPSVWLSYIWLTRTLGFPTFSQFNLSRWGCLRGPILQLHAGSIQELSIAVRTYNVLWHTCYTLLLTGILNPLLCPFHDAFSTSVCLALPGAHCPRFCPHTPPGVLAVISCHSGESIIIVISERRYHIRWVCSHVHSLFSIQRAIRVVCCCRRIIRDSILPEHFTDLTQKQIHVANWIICECWQLLSYESGRYRVCCRNPVLYTHCTFADKFMVSHLNFGSFSFLQYLSVFINFDHNWTRHEASWHWFNLSLQHIYIIFCHAHVRMNHMKYSTNATVLRCVVLDFFLPFYFYHSHLLSTEDKGWINHADHVV